MKTLRLFLLSLLAIATAVPAVAQVIEDGEAFYIYRNDGNFDGFFYDEVKEIRYSKLDLDNVEHEDYVVQEVVLEDSIHRIPLAAIDSVGFVQPEIILNPKLKNLDELGLTQYLMKIEDGGYEIIFKTIPYEMYYQLPKVGDFVVGFGGALGGVGGKVVSVIHHSTDCTIKLQPFESLGDVFQQFISVEQVKADANGNAKRRMAGIGKMRKESGKAEASMIDFEGTIKKEFHPWGENSTISLNADLGVKFTLGMAYNITWKRLFIKTTAKERLSCELSTSISMEKSYEDEWDILPGPLGTIKFPAVMPLFETSPLPTIFYKVSGTISTQLKFPKLQYGATQTVIFDTDLPYMVTGSWVEDEIPDDDEDKANGILDQLDLESSFSGSVQAGIKNNIGISTNRWAERLFMARFGFDIYTGPQISGSINIRPEAFADSGPGYRTAYSILAGSSISVVGCAINTEGKAAFKYLWKDENEDKFFEKSVNLLEVKYYAIPTLTPEKPTANVEEGSITAKCSVGNPCLLSCEIGFNLYDITDGRNAPILVETYTHPRIYRGSSDVKEFSHTFKSLGFGKYRVVPFVKTMGYTLNAITNYSDMEHFFGVELPHIIKLKPIESIPASGGTVEIPYESNLDFSKLDVVDLRAIDENGYKVYCRVFDKTNNINMFDTQKKVIRLTDFSKNSGILPKKYTFKISTIWYSLSISDNIEAKGSNEIRCMQKSYDERNIGISIITNGKALPDSGMGYGNTMKCNVSTSSDGIVTITGTYEVQHDNSEDYIKGTLNAVIDIKDLYDLNSKEGGVMKLVSCRYQHKQRYKVYSDSDEYTIINADILISNMQKPFVNNDVIFKDENAGLQEFLYEITKTAGNKSTTTVVEKTSNGVELRLLGRN